MAGDRTLMFVGGRGVLRDPDGRVLLIRRADNGYWSLPAGAMELGESIAECATREVYEETGLTVTALTPFAMYTGARYTSKNMYGHTYQLFITAFRVEGWTGELLPCTDETTAAGFFSATDLPEPLTSTVVETLADLADFEANGQLLVR
jgi:8-oxo-dGTP pyrophosphatase MutT (NUDIX family)